MVDILLVEDYEELNELMRIFLEREGYTVKGAASGEEALAFLEKEPVKLVILDVVLPGMDGFAVCASLREKSNVPIIFLSARVQKEDKMNGFLQGADDYVLPARGQYMLELSEGILLAAFLFILGILLYVKYKILKPFAVFSEMPYQLSKGNLQGELEESRDRFFGKFVWGIGMLRDALISSREKTLELEREKKLLLLSLSHDIKIPLSMIKLYAKALKEGIYDTEKQKLHAAAQVEAHAMEIEKYVKEIAAASSDDIIVIEVENSEFYIRDLVEKIRAVYAPKCRLQMTELEIGNYSNKLLKGDFDCAFEVMENLFENAFKYGDGKRITLYFSEEENCQIIRVFNTGEPLQAEELPHIFDSFYRGSNVGNKSGNGLGLYISKKIMQKMDGEIFAERKEDGMYFCVVFQM